MSLSPEIKHGLHVVACLCFILLFEYTSGAIRWNNDEPTVDPVAIYGYVGTFLLYVLRVASLLVLPQCICNTLGLLLFNGFREKVKLKSSPMLAPFICVRVVTRGDYPKLVQANLRRNMETCLSTGMANFIIEVVTDKPINLEQNARVREVVVPSSYRTKSGALFKARALQYCLEPDVSFLRDEDWIVHLDEETLLTENAVCGVLNFVMDGQHQFGQGVITYASGEIVNWITTFCDSFRVADDLGKLRFQFHYFHRPLFGWKGSYVVTQAGAERKVSFDHGRDGSIAEDCYFSMIAYRDGYTFDFIEGEMHEKSPFTFWDFLQQRKRWLQGIYLTAHSSAIPIKIKIFLLLSLYAWASLPFTVSNVLLATAMPLPRFLLFDVLVAYVGAMNLYMYIFGALKSFSHKYRQRPWRMILYTGGALLAIPFNVWIEIIAVLWGMLGRKHQFYVVNKDSAQLLEV